MSTMKTLVLAASATLVTLLSSLVLADEEFVCKTPVKTSTRCGNANTNLRLEAGQAVYVVLTSTEENICVNFTIKHGVDKKTLTQEAITLCPIDSSVKEKKEQDKQAKKLW
jgi:hypothetical protein